MVISAARLQELLAGGETGEVEFKLNAPRAAELAERICGLANRRTGGLIVIGVEDASRRLVGIRHPQETLDRTWRAIRSLKPVLHLPAPGPELLEVAGQQVVLVPIPPNNGELYQAGGIFWVRRETETTPMDKHEIAAHLQTYGPRPWELDLCPRATLADLDPALLDRYLGYRAEQGRQQRRYTPPLDLLVGLQAAASDPLTGDLRPTHAGMLVFGYDPQIHLPQSEVVCIRYLDPLGVGRYSDRKILTGPLPELIDRTATFLTDHTQVGGQIAGFQRLDEPEYPFEALREAVVNAVVHRDYSRVGETIRVFVFSDRIEVHSPGLLLPGITPTDLAALRVSSHPRNPVIAGFLRDLPGYMERVGSGIRLMVHEMARLGRPAPQFIEQHDFSVVFAKGPLDTVPEPSASTETPLPAGLTHPRQRIALALIQQHGSTTNVEYRAAAAIPDRTALRDLQDLVKQGILRVEGNTRAARYYLA